MESFQDQYQECLHFLFAATLIAVVGMLALRHVLSIKTFLFIVAIKISIPLLYFAWFRDPKWLLLDDVTYWTTAAELDKRGFNVFSILLTSDGWNTMLGSADGFHVGFYIWNLIVRQVFGPEYCLPVILNVGVTFLCAYCIHALALEVGFSKKYARGLCFFFLIHWDILIWSSFLNIKDIIVMTLLTAALLELTRFLLRRRVRDAAALTVVFLLLVFFRFYVPLLVCLSAGIWASITLKGRRRWYPLLATAILGCTYIWYVGVNYIWYYAQSLSLREFGFGFFHVFLTPQPWRIEEGYSYLVIPSIFHWVFLAPCLVGGWMLWRRREMRLVIITLTVFLSLYALFPPLRGVRQRVQLIPIICWMQYHILWAVAQFLAKQQPPVSKTSGTGILCAE